MCHNVSYMCHNVSYMCHNYNGCYIYIHVQWNLYICGDHWEPFNCPDCRGVLNSGVVLYRITTIGTKASVHFREVSLFQRCPQ